MAPGFVSQSSRKDARIIVPDAIILKRMIPMVEERFHCLSLCVRFGIAVKTWTVSPFRVEIRSVSPCRSIILRVGVIAFGSM